MSLLAIHENKKLKSKTATFSGFYFKRWNIEQTKTGYIIYNDISGDSATISKKFLSEFYNDNFLALVRQSLKDLPSFKQTNDIELLNKIERFSIGYTRFKRELITAFNIDNYSYACLFEQELPTEIQWG